MSAYFRPRAYQVPAFNSTARYNLLVWHRRGGKDITSWNRLIKRALTITGSHYFIFPYYAQARRIIWNAVTADGMQFLDMIPKNLVTRTDTQRLTIELINGSTIQLLGAKDADSLVGTQAHSLYFSEVSLHKEIIFDRLLPIMMENRDAEMLLNFTPRGRIHRSYKLYQEAIKSERWFTSILDIEQTGAMDKAEVDEIARITGMPRELVEQEYYVKFSTGLSGAYYFELIDQAYNTSRVREVLYNPNLPLVVSWDTGVADDTVLWVAQPDQDRIRIIDYYENRGEGLLHYLHFLDSRGYAHANYIFPFDIEQREMTTSKSRIEFLQDHGVFAYDILPRTPIMEGIHAVRALLPQCVFDERRCSQGLEKLAAYRPDWSEEKQVFSDKPRHDKASHAADSFRYLALGLDTFSAYQPRVPSQTTAIYKYNELDFNPELTEEDF